MPSMQCLGSDYLHCHRRTPSMTSRQQAREFEDLGKWNVRLDTGVAQVPHVSSLFEHGAFGSCFLLTGSGGLPARGSCLVQSWALSYVKHCHHTASKASFEVGCSHYTVKHDNANDNHRCLYTRPCLRHCLSLHGITLVH